MNGVNGHQFIECKKKNKKKDDGLSKKMTKEEKRKLYEEDLQFCSPKKK